MKINSLSECFLFVFQGVNLAKSLETMILEDDRFEIPAKRHLGLVVFRIKVSKKGAMKTRKRAILIELYKNLYEYLTL